MTRFKPFLRLIATTTLLAAFAPAQAVTPERQVSGTDFFNAALCKPPYSFASATALYNAAEKLGKPDTSLLTVAVYRFPKPVMVDGFTSTGVAFAVTSVGVVVDGTKAAELAERYRLKPEPPDLLLRANVTKGFASKLAVQPNAEVGTVSIVARESSALPGKTLLACEMLTHDDEAKAAAMHKVLGH